MLFLLPLRIVDCYKMVQNYKKEQGDTQDVCKGCELNISDHGWKLSTTKTFIKQFLLLR